MEPSVLGSKSVADLPRFITYSEFHFLRSLVPLCVAKWLETKDEETCLEEILALFFAKKSFYNDKCMQGSQDEVKHQII